METVGRWSDSDSQWNLRKCDPPGPERGGLRVKRQKELGSEPVRCQRPIQVER